MSAHHSFTRMDGSIIEIEITDSSDGNFHIDEDPELLSYRRAQVMPGDWAVVRQVHGSDIVDAAHMGEHTSAPEADAVLTADTDQPIAVQGADCAPMAFITNTGPIAVAHAGWRGLAAGVVQSVVDELSARGSDVDAVIVGPVIGVECYEFGSEDLGHVASLLGDDVRGQTSSGTAALDMRKAISSACARSGIDDVRFVSPCTACSGGGFSHRARKDVERHALAARILSNDAASVTS